MKLEVKPSEYKMNHARRGHAIIFNQVTFIRGDTRNGSLNDAVRLKYVLTKLGFEVKLRTDLTRQEVETQIESLARQDHSDCDCVMVVVMSHGKKGDMISARDDEYEERTLWKPFLPDSCPSLAGKPKLFILQACRGKGVDEGHSVQIDNVVSATDDVGYRTALAADFLVAYSSVRGYVSWRDEREGAWFIQSLCEVLEEPSSLDLIKILIQVHNKVMQFESKHTKPEKDKKKQVPQFVTSLTRDVVFRQNRPMSSQNVGPSEELNNCIKNENISMDSQTPDVPSTPVEKKTRTKKVKPKTEDNSSAAPGSRLAARNKEDQHDVFARNVATKLRQLEKKQRLYAEKIINEALSMAELLKLKDQCRITLPPVKKLTQKQKRNRENSLKPSTSSLQQREPGGTSAASPEARSDSVAAE